MTPLERYAFRAIFTLAFFGLLRPGEVVQSGRQKHFLRLGGIQLENNQLSLTLVTSKTSVTPVVIHMVARPDLPECPVTAIQSYLRIRGDGQQQDALFIDASRRPISGRRLNHVLRQAGSLSGINTDRLSGHCLRIGGASHAAAIGMTEVQISEAGLWSSQAMRRYLRRPMSVTRHPRQGTTHMNH